MTKKTPAAPAPCAYTSELLTIETFDGYRLQGKLRLPLSGQADRLVIFVNGSGPTTYDNYRNNNGYEFNYFDLFAQGFTANGTAFFSSSSRGVSHGDTPPLFVTIDQAAYKTYLPQNTVRDNVAIIKALKADPRLRTAKVYLLGWSEGSMIAPAVAASGSAPVDGLLLAGYVNDTLEETFLWQHSGESSMIFYRQYFDYDGDGRVTEADFNEDRYNMAGYIGQTFAELDLNGDGELDREDFAQMLAPEKTAILAAVERNDDEWLKNNFGAELGIQLTSGWFKAHRQFTPNRETLPKLTIPIHIFHGTYDANCSVQGVYDIAAAFQQLGKTNLTTHIYEGADHNLNYVEFLTTGQAPQGIQDMFDVCKTL